MKDISNMLQKIKEKPNLYLGKTSLERLSAFINGYLCRQYEEEYPSYPEFYPGFQKFIQDKYDIQSTHGWADIIAFFSSDDKDAFNNFFKDLELFLGKNNIKMDDIDGN